MCPRYDIWSPYIYVDEGLASSTGDITGCTLCEGEWTYHFALCGNANQQIGNGCLSTQFRSAYRVDGSTPTARARLRARRGMTPN